MIQGVIFDLDGTLIDSEPLWQEAEITTFASVGLELTRADCMQTKGLQPFEAVKHWHRKLINPKRNVEELAVELCERVKELFEKKLLMKEGVIEILEFWKEKKIPMAIASASSMNIIESVVKTFNLDQYFSLIYSGDFEKFGKPHPGIFITTAERMKVDPVFTVVFEDSFNGMIAAKAARMKLVAYLDEISPDDTKYDFADLKLESFHNFGAAQFNYLESLM